VSAPEWILLSCLLALAPVLLWSRARKTLREASIATPFSAEWRALLEEKLPLYRRIPPELRLELEPVARRFLADVPIIGCQGLVVTDEMRLVISVQACWLVVTQVIGAYRSLRAVLLYPDEFVVKESEEDESGVVHEGESVLSGQSIDDAQIVLSWRDVQEGGAEGEIYNVVLHEFAHFLDNSVEGALTETASGRDDLATWLELIEREYNALCDAVDRGERTLIDPYGAESTAEFFAVATETLFEAPQELQQMHPELYKDLAAFYGLDPAAW
jgi:Mlc titration factor MtfA (ptsG expression regulator)